MLALLLQIAAGYPGDVGLEKDPKVLFVERFDAPLAEIGKRWGEISKAENMALEEGALRIKGNGHLYTRLKGVDRLHARFRVKFHEKIGYVHHFVTLVADAENTPWPRGEAGKKPDGARRFTSGIEPTGVWGKFPPPGVWNFYSYWHEMKPDGRGTHWGNSFQAEQEPIQPGRWYDVEAMIDAPGEAQAFWVDGKKVGDFKGIRWRTSDALKLNAFWLLMYSTDAPARANKDPDPASRVMDVWFDDVVLATDYVGPKK